MVIEASLLGAGLGPRGMRRLRSSDGSTRLSMLTSYSGSPGPAQYTGCPHGLSPAPASRTQPPPASFAVLMYCRIAAARGLLGASDGTGVFHHESAVNARNGTPSTTAGGPPSGRMSSSDGPPDEQAPVAVHSTATATRETIGLQ